MHSKEKLLLDLVGRSHKDKDTATVGSDVLDQREPDSTWKLAKNLAFRLVSLGDDLANNRARIIKHSTPLKTNWIF